MDNQKPGPSNRLKRAKSDLLPSHSSVVLKSKIRQTFASRLRLSRSRSADQFRKLFEEVEETVPYNSFSELKDTLLGLPEAQYLLSEPELNEIMNDIENELKMADFEKQITEQNRVFELETADLLRRHLSICLNCGERFYRDLCCDECKKKIGK